MALAKNSERVKLTLTVKKTTADKLKSLAVENNRSASRQLDCIIENYNQTKNS